MRGENEWHGVDGPLWASDIPTRHELIEAVFAGCTELGIPRNEDFNGARQEGAGYYQLTTRRGFRCSTAGPLQSPQLLQLSGIGPPDVLRDAGVPVRHALSDVGENLQDHLQARVIFRCTKPITTNDVLRSWWRAAAMGLQYVLTRTGPMSVGINQGGIFARTGPSVDRPDIQFHIATLSSDMAGSPVHTFSGLTMSVCQLRPQSRGFVRIKSDAPLAAPAMQPNYPSTPGDRATLIKGIRMARALAATQALAPYIAGEYRPGAEATSDDDLLEFAKSTGGTIFHPSGTCKMGPASDPLAVVDSELRVHGIAGLRVIDCSIMPILVSGNTNAPVIMIAEKAADMIMGRHS